MNASSAIAAAVGLLVLLPILIGAVAVVITVVNRSDVDTTARRPAAVYAYATSFITVFVTLFASFAVVNSLCSLIGSHGRERSGSSIFGADSAVSGVLHPIGDAAARGIVLGLLFALVAGGIFLTHLRIGARATESLAPGEPAGRVRSSYVAAVSFVCMLVAVFATVAALYQVFRLIAPGVFSPGSGGERIPALRTLIPIAYLAVAALLLIRLHLRHAPATLREHLRFARRGRAVTQPPPAAGTPPPPPSYV